MVTPARILSVEEGITLWLLIEIINIVCLLHHRFLWAKISHMALYCCMANITTNVAGSIRRNGTHSIYAYLVNFSSQSIYFCSYETQSIHVVFSWSLLLSVYLIRPLIVIEYCIFR